MYAIIIEIFLLDTIYCYMLYTLRARGIFIFIDVMSFRHNYKLKLFIKLREKSQRRNHPCVQSILCLKVFWLKVCQIQIKDNLISFLAQCLVCPFKKFSHFDIKQISSSLSWWIDIKSLLNDSNIPNYILRWPFLTKTVSFTCYFSRYLLYRTTIHSLSPK